MSLIRVAAHVDVRYTTRQPTGVDKHIVRMVRSLAKRPGFEVSIVAPRSQLSGAGDLPAGSSLRGMPVHPLPLSNRTSRLVWAFSDRPPIDRWCPGADWIYSPQELWAPARHARTAVTIHGSTYFEPTCPGYASPWARFERARMGWFFSRVCRQADLVLPVSRYLERFLVRHFGLPPERSVVVGNGVDDCFFAAGEASAASGTSRREPDRILVVGGLNEWDGAGHVLACADVLRKRMPGISIDIVGTLDERSAVSECDRRPNVRRLGFLPPEELALIMPRYVALLYLPNVESFGMVALEAMAAGLPVLACRLTAVPETAGDAAWYVDQNCPERVVDALATLSSDRGIRGEWVQRGREHAARFTWAACVDRLSDALRQNRSARYSGRQAPSESRA